MNVPASVDGFAISLSSTNEFSLSERADLSKRIVLEHPTLHEWRNHSLATALRRGIPTPTEAAVIYSLIEDMGVPLFYDLVLPSLRQPRISFDFCEAFIHLLVDGMKTAENDEDRRTALSWIATSLLQCQVAIHTPTTVPNPFPYSYSPSDSLYGKSGGPYHALR